MKIEGGDTISAKVFLFILLQIYSDFAPILLRFCSDFVRFRWKLQKSKKPPKYNIWPIFRSIKAFWA